MKNQFITFARISASLFLAVPFLTFSASAQIPETQILEKRTKAQQSPDQTKAQSIFFQGRDKKTRSVPITQNAFSAYPHIVTQNRNNFRKNYQHVPAKNNLLMQDTTFSSVDPGIFYAPDETTTPAAQILKPLLEIDTQMVIDPNKH